MLVYIETTPNSLVRERLHNTYFVFFNKKTGRHSFQSVWGVKTYGPDGSEVEFNDFAHVKEFINHHPDSPWRAKHSYIFIGRKEDLKIGAPSTTKKWIT